MEPKQGARVWQAYTLEELARLEPGTTVVTKYTGWQDGLRSDVHKPKRKRKLFFEERVFFSYDRIRGIVSVEFSFQSRGGVCDFPDEHVGYYTIPPHDELHGDFSSD